MNVLDENIIASQCEQLRLCFEKVNATQDVRWELCIVFTSSS